MGFSTAGASVVLFAGLLFVTSTAANAFFEVQREYNDAVDQDREFDAMRKATALTEKSGGHDAAGTFYLNITNSGDTVLDLTRIGFFLDGAWAIGSITSKTVDGRITDLWAPGQILRIEANAATEPSRAYLVVETGQGILWTP